MTVYLKLSLGVACAPPRTFQTILQKQKTLHKNKWIKEEAMSLIEGGFQYITTIEGIQLFKKRK
jgi:hypothetical protein